MQVGCQLIPFRLGNTDMMLLYSPRGTEKALNLAQTHEHANDNTYLARNTRNTMFKTRLPSFPIPRLIVQDEPKWEVNIFDSCTPK